MPVSFRLLSSFLGDGASMLNSERTAGGAGELSREGARLGCGETKGLPR
jgi:hypothetical protein